MLDIEIITMNNTTNMGSGRELYTFQSYPRKYRVSRGVLIDHRTRSPTCSVDSDNNLLSTSSNTDVTIPMTNASVSMM